MSQALSILFYLKKTKTDKHGLAPIFLRTTVDGRRAEMSTHRSIDPDKWNPTGQCAKGNKEDSRNLNEYLIQMKNKVHKQYNTLQSDGVAITAEMLKDSVVGKSVKQHTLVEIFEYHNKQVWAQVGNEFAIGTAKHFDVTLRKIKSFLQHRYKRTDIPLTEINHQFITEFEFYLKTNDGCEHNTAIKHIKRLKKIVRIALANGWIISNPFFNYKCTSKETNRGYLTQEELDSLSEKSFSIDRLEIVRDIFLFSCYTGLSYIDVFKLQPSDIIIDIDGNKWIEIIRTKTDVVCKILLLHPALSILEKYKAYPECVANGKMLPVKSNQKINSYLKEIGDLCGINKKMTYHLARHTFATLMLTLGVPIESVSSMLGHRQIRTTQIYAKVIPDKIATGMKMADEALSKRDAGRKSSEQGCLGL